MSMWTAIMVLGIVAIVQFGRVMRARYNAQHGIIEDHHGRVRVGAFKVTTPAESELQREVETLRERIKVLERIATDANSVAERQSRSIAAEIESLRDR